MEIIIVLLLLIMVVGGFIAGFNYSDCLSACSYELKTCINDLEEIDADLDKDRLVGDADVARKMWKTYSQAYHHMADAAKVSMDVIFIEMVLFAVIIVIAAWVYS